MYVSLEWGRHLNGFQLQNAVAMKKTVIDYIFYLVIFFGNRLIWSAVPTLVDAPNPPKSVTPKKPTPKQRTSPATKRQRVTEGNIYIYILFIHRNSQESTTEERRTACLSPESPTTQEKPNAENKTVTCEEKVENKTKTPDKEINRKYRWIVVKIPFRPFLELYIHTIKTEPTNT